MGNLLKVLSIKRTFSSHGFTLIELLVAMGIIGIITTGLLIAVNPVEQLRKSRDAKRVDALNQIKTALELYYQDYGRYPAKSGPPLNAAITPINQIIDGSNPSTSINWNSGWSPYMQILPEDPAASGGKRFQYWSSTDGQSFAVYASMDRGEYTCTVGNTTAVCGSAVGRLGSATACGGTCNYAVTSGNVSP